MFRLLTFALTALILLGGCGGHNPMKTAKGEWHGGLETTYSKEGAALDLYVTWEIQVNPAENFVKIRSSASSDNPILNKKVQHMGKSKFLRNPKTGPESIFVERPKGKREDGIRLVRIDVRGPKKASAVVVGHDGKPELTIPLTPAENEIERKTVPFETFKKMGE